MYDAPEFCKTPVFLTLTGSLAYGLANEDSDVDVVGVCIPDDKYVYPSHYGLIPEFDDIPKFQQYKKHGTVYNKVEYDITIYSLPRYFRLCLDGNINIIETLFIDPAFHILSDSFQDALSNKREFLSLNCFYKFMGFANAHLKRLESGRGRQRLVEKFGHDVKDACYLIRAYQQCILLLQGKDLQPNKYADVLLEIKRGEWKVQDTLDLARQKQQWCETLRETTNLQDKPDMGVLRKLLIRTLRT